MPNFPSLLEQTTALHNHLCPRQVLGVRMGMHAADLLNLDLPQSDKRLFTFVETDGCFADGISVATGCRLGRRTLRLVDYGKVAALFVDTHTRQAIRISPNPLARGQACHYAPDASDLWHAQLIAYQLMPTTELLRVQNVTLTLSMEAMISQPGLRVTCGGCGEEVMNEREMRVDGQTLCRRCAGQESYYEQT